jgi:hypothetical protein
VPVTALDLKMSAFITEKVKMSLLKHEHAYLLSLEQTVQCTAASATICALISPSEHVQRS